MQKTLTYKGAVMTWECDSNNHMNVMYYINKFENGGRNYSLELGLTPFMNDEVGVVVVEQTIQYFKEVFEDDLLFIESSVEKVSNKTITIIHEMYNGFSKEKVSEMKVVIVMFDKINRKAMALPEEVRSKLLKSLATN